MLKFNKVALALVLASCDHQKYKLRAVAGVEGFWVAELRVRQLKLGRKSCFGNFLVLYCISTVFTTKFTGTVFTFVRKQLLIT